MATFQQESKTTRKASSENLKILLFMGFIPSIYVIGKLITEFF